MRNCGVRKTSIVHLYIAFLWDVETPSPTDGCFVRINAGVNCVRPQNVKYLMKHHRRS